MRKFLAVFTAFFMVAVGLTAMPPAPAQAAPPGSAFDPGNIISDSVFYDFGSMSVEEIQDFLDSRVQNCRAEDPAIDCLKNIKVDIPEVAATGPDEVGPCSAIPAMPQASAAQVIFTVSNACGINPKVLIVTLQKEQGLVTSTKPTEYMYRAAMGFGCPDSDPAICGKVFVGLFNQLYRAARQLQWYGDPAGSFTYWKPGRTVAMRYHPKSSCGTKSFELKNQATAALYYYTPYTPNEAALNNMYGVGDSCSAYGNRNFWRFFHDWFGSPVAGGYLVRAEGTAEVYLITDKAKFLISDTRLVAAYEPLGPVGEVSQVYLDSFEDLGIAPQLAVSPSGQRFLIAGGKRHLVPDCNVLAQFGLSCDTAVAMGDWQLKLLPQGDDLQQIVQASDGSQYWVANASYGLLPFRSSVELVGGSSLKPTELELNHMVSLTPGAPIIPDGLAFRIAGSAELGISSAGRIFPVSEDLAKAIELEKWFTVVDTSVDPLQLAGSISGGTNVGVVRNSDMEYFLLSNRGKYRLTEESALRETAVFWPKLLLDRLPEVGELGESAVLQNGPHNVFVDGSERRTIRTTYSRNRFLGMVGQDAVVPIVKPLANTLTHLGAAMAPGTIVKQARTETRYLVDGVSSLIPIANSALVEELQAREITFGNASLVNFTLRAELSSPKVSCDGRDFLIIGGELVQISDSMSDNFPGDSYPLKSSTCHAIGIDTEAMGSFLIDQKNRAWAIQDGKRWLLTDAQYASLRSAGKAGRAVPRLYFDFVPSAGKAPTDFTLAPANLPFEIASVQLDFDMVETDPKAVPFDSSVTPVTTPTPSPTPKPTPTPTPTPEPTPSEPEAPAVDDGESAGPENQQNTYVVQPGDTLLRIAAKFGTTVDELVRLNKLSNPNSIRVGQVLIIAAQTETPAAEAEPEPEAPKPVYYTVVAGDTLLMIAVKFGVTVDQLAKANNISNPNSIRVGQRLLIPTGEFQAPAPAEQPAPVQLTYTVQAGDTLWGIARKFNVSATALAELNGINNSNFIRVGQVLKIPS